MSISNVKVSQITSAKEIIRSNTLGEPLYLGAEPTIASGGSNIVLGFDDIEAFGTAFTFATGGGSAWHESAYGWDLGDTLYPSVDYSAGNRFYGTVDPDWSTNGQVTQMDFIDVLDPETWTAGTWDWGQYDINEFEGLQISAMDDSMEEWRWGFITMSGYNGYSQPSAEGCPYVQYATDDGYATISWLTDGDTGNTLEGCGAAAGEIDPIGYHNYAIWERYNDDSGVYNLEFRKDECDAPAGESGFVSAGELLTPENNRNPDVSAYDDNVIVVSEADGDIVCYYSLDGMSNFETSFIASSGSDEMSPRIVATGSNEATCTFTMNGNLYYSTTENGGATWSTATQVNDPGETVNDGYQQSEISELGACYAGTDDVVYFAPLGATPIITIDSISGGIGVTAVIKNVGTADATGVDCSITVTGGILGLIDKQVTTTENIVAGAEVTISSGMILGIGAVEITVTAGAASQSITGTNILIYTSI